MKTLDETKEEKPQISDDEFLSQMHRLVKRAKEDRERVSTIEERDNTAVFKRRITIEKVEELTSLLSDAANQVPNWQSTRSRKVTRNTWKVLRKVFVDKEVDSYEKGYTLLEMARAWAILTGDLSPIRDLEKTIASMIARINRDSSESDIEIRSESVDGIRRYFWHRKFKDLKGYHDRRGGVLDGYMVPFVEREKKLIA